MENSAIRNQAAYFNNTTSSSVMVRTPGTPSSDILKPHITTTSASSPSFSRQHVRAQSIVDGPSLDAVNAVKQVSVLFLISQGYGPNIHLELCQVYRL